MYFKPSFPVSKLIVKYKLIGAVKEKADIFFVPFGENYDEMKAEVIKLLRLKYALEVVNENPLDFLINRFV